MDSGNMKSKQGRNPARICAARCGAVFSATSATPELAGATATASALTLRLKFNCFPYSSPASRRPHPS
ncbi:uncharacterized protein PHACADRAFT_167251 [Phanerochaete carnosa HHB-10118-sp]|uniref:Uncharacterized protein n=1 Tax=Phanerochaete carnosa (strain HHB-10118-sp) TaxID=650164 RepID=K5VRF7_PHACS|nr:uncharacterized protein PHACADRAFT_167251 [Phanerochaete carnosa HHB-10118-sp]EKM49310.1 hypothetical protein PHACADRAFT_167251 [Phanerochaete carnosa HHB-10118-sp]